jgi:hypothetical protein
VYFRSWFSLASEAQGGRPYVVKLVKEDGLWKVDVRASLKLTSQITKGIGQFGFYDGTAEWWK